jgi:hypothetical protein
MDRSGDRALSSAPVTLARLSAVALFVFYAASAHLTRGHEADFGKQWLAARLVATGHGTRLYDPVVQRAELEEHFSSEVIERGIWREGIGGPTYPPTLAVLFAPLGLLPPHAAQWCVVQFSLLLVLLAARQVQRFTAGRMSWEAAALATLAMPSFFLAMGVGQNSAMSLAILASGWSLLVRERPLAAGAVWGLFALKPTWGIALAWIPAVVGRPRAYLGMAASAGALCLMTLPVCGVQSWLDWLAVAKETEHLYETLPRWTALSRDLPGLFRRMGQGTLVELAGWASVAAAVAVSGRVWWMSRATQRITAVGPRAAMMLAATLLACPRFMFYDMTLAVVPFLAAFSGWSELSRGSRRALVSIATLLWGGPAISYLQWQMLGPPLDTFALIGLWLWAIVQTYRTEPGRKPAPAWVETEPAHEPVAASV